MTYQIKLNNFQVQTLIELLQDNSTVDEKVTIRQELDSSLVVSFGNIMETFQVTTSGTIIKDEE
jgi:hypothetical protein